MSGRGGLASEGKPGRGPPGEKRENLGPVLGGPTRRRSPPPRKRWSSGGMGAPDRHRGGRAGSAGECCGRDHIEHQPASRSLGMAGGSDPMLELALPSIDSRLDRRSVHRFGGFATIISTFLRASFCIADVSIGSRLQQTRRWSGTGTPAAGRRAVRVASADGHAFTVRGAFGEHLGADGGAVVGDGAPITSTSQPETPRRRPGGRQWFRNHGPEPANRWVAAASGRAAVFCAILFWRPLRRATHPYVRMTGSR